MKLILPLLVLLLFMPLLAFSQTPPEPSPPPPVAPPTVAPPTDVVAKDTPNDAGLSISVTFKPSTDDGAKPPKITGYDILRSPAGKDSFEVTGFSPRVAPEPRGLFNDAAVPLDGASYVYKVKAVGVDGGQGFSDPSQPTQSSQQWFNTARINALATTVVFLIFVVIFVSRAKSGKSLYIRRIAGLSAVEEAVGRATEMGRPMLYILGLGTVSDVATLASLNILSQVAKKAAEYETPLLVPNFDPIVYNVSHEVVKEAYLKVGKPEAFRADNVYFVTNDQMGYAAAVDGIMVRERPATNIFMGTFFAEYLILAETGATTGAIQIAGTDMVTQLPFFITACDYTIMGEELYAASAYLARDPLLLGTLKAQDLTKILIVATLVLGALATIALRANWFITLLSVG
jgi:hypothetical protein